MIYNGLSMIDLSSSSSQQLFEQLGVKNR